MVLGGLVWKLIVFFSMKFPYCPNQSCTKHELRSDSTNLVVVKSGSYYRTSDKKTVLMYRCKACKRRFSKESFSYFKWEKKRHLNSKIRVLLCSNVSQRRTARILGINHKTVARKFERLSHLARLEFEEKLKSRVLIQSIDKVDFDDMESSIHSKLIPVSIPLAVDKKSRRILGFDVQFMPAKGKLAAISRKKYGAIPDHRKKGWNSLMESIKPFVKPDGEIHSDENPHYPPILNTHFVDTKHYRHKGKRGCVVGQGELKKQVFDPLFSLNHTAAMLRANINRLNRRTWCTSKKIERLFDHIALYAHYHNEVLIS